MTNSNSQVYPDLREFIQRYEKWRTIYEQVGRPPRDKAVWEDQRLLLPRGYPFEGWTAYIIAESGDGYEVLTSTTERRSEPVESLAGSFTDFQDAGKYVIWNIGESLRVSCRIDPVEWAWDDMGLDSRVDVIPMGKYQSKYILRSDPTRSFILKAGGVRPENRLLPLTYNELDEALIADIPDVQLRQREV